jgi:hypothetical protein
MAPIELTPNQIRRNHLTSCQLIVGNASIKGHQGEAYGLLMKWLEDEIQHTEKLILLEAAAADPQGHLPLNPIDAISSIYTSEGNPSG